MAWLHVPLLENGRTSSRHAVGIGGDCPLGPVHTLPTAPRDPMRLSDPLVNLKPPEPVSAKKRLLCVAESVTLAQVVRLVSLARRLPHESYDVHFACSVFPELVFEGTHFTQHRLESLAPELAAEALQAGRRLYERSTLLRYIAA